jgi:hypothetical protein|tara:strand:+ start:1297 stop:2562 length:1266 start_codon:yes stop_codon:yes gene_type:complete
MYEEKKRAISLKGGKLKINKRQLKIRLLAIIVIFLFVYVVGEITVRIFDPQPLYNKHDPAYPTYPKEVGYDQDLGWVTVKDYKVEPHTYQGRNPVITITHNSRGYRMDHEVDESKSKVVMTGDSLTYGFWVDDKKIVSSRLNEKLGNEWEVINLGAGGYGTDQAFLRFIRDGLQHKPKVVVHTLFNNDFSNIVSTYQYNVYKPRFTFTEEGILQLTNVPVPISQDMELSYPKEKEHIHKGFKRFMRSWSHFYILYKNKVAQIKGAIREKLNPPEKQDYTKAYKDGVFWAIEREYSDVMNYAFNLNALILREYDKLAKEKNITFVFVVMGDRISVDPEMQRVTEDKYFNVDEDFFDYERSYNLLEQFAKENNILIINLLPLFKEEFSKGNDMYLDGDNHLNDYGHELFAREIHNLMIREGLI